MKKQVEMWHLVIYGAFFIGSCLTVLINQSNRITRDESEIIHLQENKAENDKHFEDVNTNLRLMNDQLTSIRVLLEDKQDRKK